MWKQIKESSNVEKFGLFLAVLGAILSLIFRHWSTFVLWILVIMQDLTAISKDEYIRELQAENLSLFATLAGLELPKEEDND